MRINAKAQRRQEEKKLCVSASLRYLCVFVLILFTVDAFSEEAIITKAFSIKFRKVEEAVSLINGLLSEKGAVTMQPHIKTIVVQDFEKNLRQVEMALSAFDTPPPSVEVSIKLVLARRLDKSPDVAQEIKDIGKVGEVLRFNSYTLLDNGIITSEEGQNATLNLAKEYQISFLTDVVQEENGVIRLKNFQLKKKKKGRAKEPMVPLLSVTLNLRDAETLVLGASRFEESNHALLIILLGKVKR
jgi:type II secretory pathway component GspD/PulD (secretin)